MIPIEVWATYTLASMLVILAPGPDNLLAISRGLSQGWRAACVSSLGAGCGLMIHVMAATMGLALLLQTSAIAFGVVKLVGAGYLIWLGLKALLSQNLISFADRPKSAYGSVWLTGFLTNVLNPKASVFFIAFVPQFVSSVRGPIVEQVLVLGLWVVFLAVVSFALLGCFASTLADWFRARPRAVFGVNAGAGLVLLSAGISVAAMERK